MVEKRYDLNYEPVSDLTPPQREAILAAELLQVKKEIRERQGFAPKIKIGVHRMEAIDWISLSSDPDFIHR